VDYTDSSGRTASDNAEVISTSMWFSPLPAELSAWHRPIGRPLAAGGCRPWVTAKYSNGFDFDAASNHSGDDLDEDVNAGSWQVLRRRLRQRRRRPVLLRRLRRRRRVLRRRLRRTAAAGKYSTAPSTAAASFDGAFNGGGRRRLSTARFDGFDGAFNGGGTQAASVPPQLRRRLRRRRADLARRAWPPTFDGAFNGDGGQHPAAAIHGGGGEANQRQPFFSASSVT
jgi:hypothetical protein